MKAILNGRGCRRQACGRVFRLEQGKIMEEGKTAVALGEVAGMTGS